jgi:2-polyprenyl-3-methyl-5-hydroxy-6-metoxy-1,4-benzoquinol methylase
MSSAPPGTAPPPVWQTCLDIEGQEAGHYKDIANESLLLVVDGEPGRVLDLGCAGGKLGEILKERHPGTHVTGIEAGHAAAALAATRLDRVVRARLESVDFAAEGIEPGSFDLVIAGDILEHLVNPWAELVRLRPLIAPGGRLVASVPNVRNLQVLRGLAEAGRFEYDERGLLDVTHLRFFALDDINAMFETTGYRVETFMFTISQPLKQVFADGKGQGNLTLDMGRMRLANVSQRELMEFCAEQYILRARPRP